MAPVTGFHSVIDSPLSVSRVIPPTTIITTTSAATANSQRASASGRVLSPKIDSPSRAPDFATMPPPLLRGAAKRKPPLAAGAPRPRRAFVMLNLVQHPSGEGDLWAKIG